MPTIAHMPTPKSLLKIVTRQKELAHGEVKPTARIVELTLGKLEVYFKFPLITAAERLNISLTALKWWGSKAIDSNRSLPHSV